MKKIFSISLLSLALILSAFSQNRTIDGAIGALQSGNAAELSKYFDNNVELKMPEKSDSYSKAQAQIILRDFFALKGVKGFEVKHKSENDQRGGYFIGNLLSNSGKFRTTVFMRGKGDRQFVKEISFQMIE